MGISVMSYQRSSEMLLDHLLVRQFLLLVLNVGRLVLNVLRSCCKLPLYLKLSCRCFAFSSGFLLDRMSRRRWLKRGVRIVLNWHWLILDEIRKLVRHSHAIKTTYITSMSLRTVRIRKLWWCSLCLDCNLFGYYFRLLLLLKFLLLHLGYSFCIQIVSNHVFLHKAVISLW